MHSADGSLDTSINYDVRANDDKNDKHLTGEERCAGFDAFQAKIKPEVFGEKLGPVENAEVAFVGGKPKFLGRSMVGLTEFTVHIDNAISAADGGGYVGGGAARCMALEHAMQSKASIAENQCFLM